MTSKKFNFTKTTLTNIKLPENNKRIYLYDIQVKGLGIMVFPTGTKTFFIYKRIGGRPDKIKIGKFPEMTVEQARKAAYKAISLINEGKNPKETKKEHSTEIFFKDLFLKFLNEYAKKRKKLGKKMKVCIDDTYLVYIIRK